MTRHFLMTLAMIASLFFVAGCAYVAGRVDGMADALEMLAPESTTSPRSKKPPSTSSRIEASHRISVRIDKIEV
ncbi:hypothetical protein [Afifella marina]|uniref:Lipoprotein n=1 Tax=Afifella marina DSM 2698 TaxID=1120955 RepID=A0A1G5NYD0_AFIMA|nr:hypothetical protein [Afifella marina]MBK1624935.1 hypothetical protein [Afifella marina DSM 2698]MBK1628638.1 hypothetical protein [Afifella marina]MBK5916468.1 hypothetical protein [Afifella marina]RAI17709.1 hypothetical protein CH311_17620 [Afifella marina DSM 2698]SCZ42264.1 hypothetical protein SAMN03080610_02888 [Afifella marina DSM 2698]